MKKTILLVICAVFMGTFTFAQPWLKNLPKNKTTKTATFFELQKAFNQYWKGYDIKNGWYTDENGKKQKAYGWKQFKRSEQFWKDRVNPVTGEYPKTTAAAEYKKAARKYKYTRSSNGNWTNLGVNSSPGGYYGIGRIASVGFHPTNDNVFWACTPAGGLWGTKDAGTTWTPLNDNNEVLGVSCMVVPSDYQTSRTLYIGTGDRDAQDNFSVGVLKSTDEGLTWQPTGLVFQPSQAETVNAMLINPTNDNEILAATTAGLYKTTDAGANWTTIYNYEFVDIEYQPGNTATIYASTRGGSIQVSTDSGLNWSPKFSDQAGRIELAVSANNPTRVYALVSGTGNGLQGIFRSDDAGASFQLVYNSKNLLGWSEVGTDGGGQGWYDLSLATDPTNANILYVGGVNTWKSIDGGNSWQISSHWYGGGGATEVHADKHTLKFRNNTSTIFECNDGGLYRKTATQDWTFISNGIVNSQIYHLGVAQTSPDATVIGLQDNGTKYRENGSWNDVMGGDGMDCAIDPTDINIQYGSQYNGVIEKTTNNWISSTSISNNIPDNTKGAWVTPYVIDPSNPSTIYVGYTKLWKSTNRGQTFTLAGNFSFGTLDAITVAPSNSNIIYASKGGVIWKTVNGGTDWTNISAGLSTFNSQISQITVKNDEPQTVWLASPGFDTDGVLQTTDGGTTWTNISTGLPRIPVKSIVQNKLESSVVQLYAGTDFGVYVKNGPSNWIPFSTGLPNVVVAELEIYYDNITPTNSKLRAATYGRGLWESDLDLSGNFAPYVQTTSISNITTNSATASGETINDFGASASENGIVYSLNQDPNIGETGVTKAISTSIGLGAFSANLTGLLPGEVYYYRAYSTNQNGTGYGVTQSFVSGCIAETNIPWQENLETISPALNCWTQTRLNGASLSWKLAQGNGSSNPAFAKEGVTNFLLKNSNPTPQTVILSSPIFDLSGFSNLSLSFWHVHQQLFSFKDTLRVLYRSAPTNQWTILATLGTPVSDWTKEVINLPNLSAQYSFAFEGITGGARGIGIDDIKIGNFTSVKNIEKNKLTIFPNPSQNGIFNIKPDNFSKEVTIIISEITGKIVLNKKVSTPNKTIEIDLSKNHKGLYLIQLISEKSIFTQKLIIE